MAHIDPNKLRVSSGIVGDEWRLVLWRRCIFEGAHGSSSIELGIRSTLNPKPQALNPKPFNLKP